MERKEAIPQELLLAVRAAFALLWYLPANVNHGVPGSENAQGEDVAYREDGMPAPPSCLPHHQLYCLLLASICDRSQQ